MGWAERHLTENERILEALRVVRPRIGVFEVDVLLPSEQWSTRFRYDGHVVAQHRAGRHWGCDCWPWRSRRDCKHLRRLGLPPHETPCEADVEVT